MFRRILLPTMLAFLAWGFWVSPHFKEITAGVAIFLFGMLSMEEGFRAFTGGTLERILKKGTNRIWKSLVFGMASTTIMQSSSLVSVIAISFLSAGLISLVAGIGIVFGANLGTTSGAWLVAAFGLKVKLSAYAMPVLVFGVVLVFQKSKNLRGLGYALTGVGLLFLGIHHMKEGFEAFKAGIDLSAYAMSGYPGLFLFVAIGIAATVIMQSSHAALVLVITALAAGQVTYENALALAIGSNVGTTITAILGSMSSNIEGKRLAGAHLIFNLVTGVLAIALMSQIVWLVDWLADLMRIDEDNYTLKLAVFHTVFNSMGILLMVPFITRLALALEKWLPDPTPAFEQPKYLNKSSIDFAGAAIEAARLETLRLYDKSVELIVHGIGLHRRDVIDTDSNHEASTNQEPIEEMFQERYERSIKSIYGAIIEFISRARIGKDSESSEELFSIRMAGRDIVEAVKGVKHLQKNLMKHIGSSNPHVAAAYVEIQQRIALVLREIDSVRQGQDPLAILELNNTKVTIKQQDILANEVLDELVRNHKITAAEATSIINDNGYAYGACKCLINLGQRLFAIQDNEARDAERSLALDEGEIAAMAGEDTP